MKDGTYLVTPYEIVNYGERWAYGYFVGLPGGYSFSKGELVGLGLATTRMLSELTGQSLIGWWTDPETGIVHIDPVEHVADYETAVAHARQRGELAIWDAREDREVRV